MVKREQQQLSPTASGRSIQDLHHALNVRPISPAAGKWPQRSPTLQEWVVTAARDAPSLLLKAWKPRCPHASGDSLHQAGMLWSSRSTGAEHSPPVQYDCLAKSTALADSYTATDIAYQHNAGLTICATGVTKDSNFPVDIGSSFRQRQLEPKHSSWDSNAFSTGVVFIWHCSRDVQKASVSSVNSIVGRNHISLLLCTMV